MSWRFRKVFKSGPFRTTWSKKGLGFSWGFPGFRYGISPDGRRYISFGISGTGLYYIKYLDQAQKQQQTTLPLTNSKPILPPPPIKQTKQPWWKQKGLND